MHQPDELISATKAEFLRLKGVGVDGIQSDFLVVVCRCAQSGE